MNFVIAFLVIALFMSLCGVSVVVPKVAKLEENAQVAGLEIGDEILAVDGMETADSNAVAQAIADSNGDAVTLTVRRDGQTLDLTITPFYDEDDGRYRVGFSFGRENMRLPIWSSIPFSVQYNIESVKTILDALKNMVFRGKGVDDMTARSARSTSFRKSRGRAALRSIWKCWR